MSKIKEHSRKRITDSLFHNSFHTVSTAQKLKGDWFAKWTQANADGTESIFEVHPVEIWTTNERLRIVGKAKEGAKYYPMEGVISSSGHVALSYWSEAEIPICGTAFLNLIGGNRIMVGNWEGNTAATLNEELSIIRGRVVIGRSHEIVQNYWDLYPRVKP